MTNFNENDARYHYEGGLVCETDLAYRVAFNDGYEFWVPKSEMESLNISEDEFLIKFSLPEWLHEEKNSDYEDYKEETDSQTQKKKTPRKRWMP